MINLKLTTDEVNAVLLGLLELPAKFSLDIINKIREQSAPQIEKTEEQKKSH